MNILISYMEKQIDQMERFFCFKFDYTYKGKIVYQLSPKGHLANQVSKSSDHVFEILNSRPLHLFGFIFLDKNATLSCTCLKIMYQYVYTFYVSDYRDQSVSCPMTIPICSLGMFCICYEHISVAKQIILWIIPKSKTEKLKHNSYSFQVSRQDNIWPRKGFVQQYRMLVSWHHFESGHCNSVL